MSFENAHEVSAQVEDSIAKNLAGSGLDVKSRNITVHFEPTMGTNNPPPESIIEKSASRVGGVRGVHNILVSRIGSTGSVGVSLHIQVNRSATLAEAHSVANAVEDSIRQRLKGIESITVHLEPLMPETVGVEPIADSNLKDSIRETILRSGGVKQVSKILTYRAGENMLKIDIDCVFDSRAGATMMIEQVHDRVSEIEKQIRKKYPKSIVTIHAEPS
jgi:divalent metal cation (Fe/Co/Zn/Cd) transporter